MTGSVTTDADELVSRWPYDFQEIPSGSDHYQYLGVFATELDAVNASINELYTQQNIESATGRELEKLAAEVGLTRRDGENDDSLQFRAKLAKIVGTSDGTAQDIEALFDLVFDESTVKSTDVTKETGDPIIRFNIPSGALSDIPITTSEFKSEIERAFPCGFGVNIIEGDIFEFGASGSKGLGNGKLV